MDIPTYSFKISPKPHPEDSEFCKESLSEGFSFTVSEYPIMPEKEDLFVMNHPSLQEHTGQKEIVLKVLHRAHRMNSGNVDFVLRCKILTPTEVQALDETYLLGLN